MKRSISLVRAYTQVKAIAQLDSMAIAYYNIWRTIDFASPINLKTMKLEKTSLLQSIGFCLLAICLYLTQIGPALAAEMPLEINSNPYETEFEINTSGSTYFMDKHAWTLFAKVNQKAPTQCPGTNNSIWETWTDNAETFLREQPTWPETCGSAEAPRRKILRERSINLFLEAPDKQIIAGTELINSSEERVEEVRRNRATFDYIVNNKLWNREGLIEAYARDEKIEFPTDAMEVKADWVPISESEKDKYHWNYTKDGTLVGMRAMHVITKELPNWFWASFEWVDNLGRCDDIGCVDNFGVTPHVVRPNDTRDLKYASEELTPELEQLFAANGLTGEWGEQFKNYRLKGTQISFVDVTGKPTLLGNSITEQNAVFGSSCITCHAQARIGPSGRTTQVLTLVGSPQPELFEKFKSTGFVWSIPLCVNYPWACKS